MFIAAIVVHGVIDAEGGLRKWIEMREVVPIEAPPLYLSRDDRYLSVKTQFSDKEWVLSDDGGKVIYAPGVTENGGTPMIEDAGRVRSHVEYRLGRTPFSEAAYYRPAILKKRTVLGTKQLGERHEIRSSRETVCIGLLPVKKAVSGDSVFIVDVGLN